MSQVAPTKAIIMKPDGFIIQTERCSKNAIIATADSILTLRIAAAIAMAATPPRKLSTSPKNLLKTWWRHH